MEEISINPKILKTRKITRLVVQAEINLTAISTSLIPTLAKEDARKAPKSEREGALSLRNPKNRTKRPMLPRVVEGGRKKSQPTHSLIKSQNYY